MSSLSFECDTCNTTTPFYTSTSVSSRGQSYDVNRRIVYSTLEMGCGYEGIATLCSIMNIPCLSKPAYYQHIDAILPVLENIAKDEMEEAWKKRRQVVLAENGESDNGQILDVSVSFDGTWAKRGFTSLTGVVFVISVETGEVLDYHLLSKACQKCNLKKSKSTSDAEFEE